MVEELHLEGFLQAEVCRKHGRSRRQRMIVVVSYHGFRVPEERSAIAEHGAGGYVFTLVETDNAAALESLPGVLWVNPAQAGRFEDDNGGAAIVAEDGNSWQLAQETVPVSRRTNEYT